MIWPESPSSSVRVVATRDVGPLELVLLDDSVVVGPDLALNTYDKCAHCGNKSKDEDNDMIKVREITTIPCYLAFR